MSSLILHSSSNYPEAFIHAKDGLFDETGNIGAGSKEFLQNWMNQYVVWVKKHVGL